MNNPAAMQFHGQARKSLWIETARKREVWGSCTGQARKSLWIETPTDALTVFGATGSGS